MPGPLPRCNELSPLPFVLSLSKDVPNVCGWHGNIPIYGRMASAHPRHRRTHLHILVS
jgi:hypothetical protein